MQKIIDAHAHIFPEKIAEKAVKSIGQFYGIDMDNSGTSDKLIHSGAEINVEKFLVCSTATKPEQVVAINDFILNECAKYDKFIGFATVHPDMDGLEQEIERILASGLIGIKLHPDFQMFNIDDKKAMPIYELCKDKLTILFHTGDMRYDFSAPTRLANIAKAYPTLKVIAAHFGGYQRWDEAYDNYKTDNIFMDTSSSLMEMDKSQATRMFEKFGTERFFFGTDFPMWSHKDELERINGVGLSDTALEKILYDNFNNTILK